MSDKSIGTALMILLTLVPLVYMLVTGKKNVDVSIFTIAGFVALYALGMVMAFK